MKTNHLSIFCLSIGLFLLAGACSQESADISVDPGQAGSITRFAVHNGFMYALNPNQVRTFSLENPDKPQLVHTLTTDYGLETIIIYDNTIFLGSRTSLYILDISNPATPSILSQTQREDFLFGGCDPVVVKDNFAYSTIKIIENVCFDILQPRKNRKGDRHFRPVAIKNLVMIYDLLRRRKFTIEGAKDYLKKNKKAEEKFATIQSLQKIKGFLLELKASL